MPDSFSIAQRECRRRLSPQCCILLKTGLLFFLLCLVAGCDDGGKQVSDKSKSSALLPQSGGVYSLPLLNNPKSLDPALAEDQYSAAVVYQLFDGLVRFSPDLLVIPALAENWRIEQGGLVYRFFIRKEARFHNGRAVSAQDVLFSFSRLLRTDPAPSILPHLLRITGARAFREGKTDNLQGFEIINHREFQVRLEEPYAPFLAALGMHQTRIVPEDEILRKGDDFSRNPVGSGAFRFISWEKDKSVHLGRFLGYYLGPSLLDEVRYAIYPGGRIEEALADFKAGKLQEMPVYGKIRKELQTQKNLKSTHRPSLSLLFYGINCEHPLLRQPAMRRALSLAIDREKLVSTVYEGQFEHARSILPPGVLGYSPEHLGVKDDLDLARKEFAQAISNEPGAEHLSIEIVSAVESTVAKAELAFIAQCWEKLGISVRIKFIPNWAEFEQYVQSPSMQVYRYAWFMDIPDPDNILQVLFASDSNINYMRYKDSEVDRLLRAARIQFEPAERAGIYQQIQELILKTAPVIPLVHLSSDQVYQSNVQGIQLNALGGHKSSLYQVWLSHNGNK